MKPSPSLLLAALLPLSACALDAGAAPIALSAELLAEIARSAAGKAEASPAPAALAARPRAARPAADLAPQEGERRIALGIGFTDSPDTFLIGGSADFYQSNRVAIGPSLQLGVDDNTTIFAPSFHGKFVFPLERNGDGAQFVPFVQGGAGITYIDKDRVGDDWGFLLQAGGGIEVRFDDHYALTSTVLANLLPGEVADERSWFSWEIVQFSFVF